MNDLLKKTILELEEAKAILSALQDGDFEAQANQIMHRIDQAITLLETYTPRILTLDEAIYNSNLVYYERKGDIPKPAYVYPGNKDCCDILSMGSVQLLNEKKSDYGISWCCWSAWPTNEQREHVVWNERTE